MPYDVRPMMKYGESGVASIQLPSGYTMNNVGLLSPGRWPPMMAWELNRRPLSCRDGPSSTFTRLSWSPNAVTTSYRRGNGVGRAASSSSRRMTALSRIERTPDVITNTGRPP